MKLKTLLLSLALLLLGAAQGLAATTRTVTFDCPLTVVYQSDDRAYTYVTDTYQRHNVLLWCPDGLPVTLARDEELRAGLSGLKTTQGELTVLQVDAATVAKVTAIQVSSP